MKNIPKNIQDHIPKSLNLTDILWNIKKILWVFILLFIAFNIVLFYFLNGLVYFVTLIIWNVIFVWICIPIMMWIGKSILVDRWMDAATEMKQKFSWWGEEWEKFAKDKVIKVVKKQD